MAARQSDVVTKALRAVARGQTPYSVAKKYGIVLSTIYRALKRQREASRDVG